MNLMTTKPLTVLITGANGQLGRCLQERAPSSWQLTAMDSSQLDITNTSQIKEILATTKPNVVINAAAYTAVDLAENEPARAFLVNATAVGNLATATHAIGARLVHVSTDYVFDGTTSQPYTPLDAPKPINVYGKSKLAGELLALAHNPQAQVIRTSWVYSEYGKNFVKTMLRLATKGHDTISVVNDQYGCPTYAGNLAQFIIELIEQPAAERLVHYTDGEPMSWYEFAQRIFATSSAQGKPVPTVHAIATADYSTPARRPTYSVLLSHTSNFVPTSLAQVMLKL